SASPWGLHHPAIRGLRALWRVHHTGLDGDDPALQRDAIVTLDGLRSRDGQYAHVARQSVATLVSPELQAHRRNLRLAAAGLCLPRHSLALGDRTAAHRLSHRASSADSLGADARSARHVALFRRQATGELRRRNELRDLPDVLCLVRALPAMAG